MNRKEEFLAYVLSIEKSISPDMLTACAIQLRIKMPTGEIETIINPNIKAKVDYINRAYDEDLKLKACKDIYIVSYTIE